MELADATTSHANRRMTLLLLATVLSVQQVLDTALVWIDVADHRAAVRASYHLSTPSDSVRLAVMVLGGQRIEMRGESGSELTPAGGLAHFTVLADSGDGRRANIRYDVLGNLDRIPIFVPPAPTRPAESVVRIVIDGVAPGARLEDGFPRLVRRGERVVVAVPENLPSFVRLPPPKGTLSINRVAEGMVLVLLFGASGYWVLRQRARHRRSRS